MFVSRISPQPSLWCSPLLGLFSFLDELEEPLFPGHCGAGTPKLFPPQSLGMFNTRKELSEPTEEDSQE